MFSLTEIQVSAELHYPSVCLTLRVQEVITIKLSMSIVLDLCITFDLVVLLRQNTSEFPS